MAGKKRVGIVLFQLGGPDSLEAVEPFLLNLFLDPDIIPLGPLGLLRRPIAKLISSRRSKPVAGKYAEIGRRSPIATLTERQRVRLVEAVAPYMDAVAVTAMRYWHPMTSEAVDSLRKAGALDEIVLLPLYPQYSYATTLSSLKEWRRVVQQSGWEPASVRPPELHGSVLRSCGDDIAVGAEGDSVDRLAPAGRLLARIHQRTVKRLRVKLREW